MGADYSAYAYVRAFREAYGARPIICASFDVKSISRTRFADYRVVEGIDEPEVLLATLREMGEELCSAGRLPFLVTCGDFYARIVSQHKAELERWFYTPVVDFAVLDLVTQKENFYRVCDEVGVAYPRTRFLDCSDPSAEASPPTRPPTTTPSSRARRRSSTSTSPPSCGASSTRSSARATTRASSCRSTWAAGTPTCTPSTSTRTRTRT